MGPKKTPQYYHNRVQMARMRNKQRSFVMVEGPTDVALWSEFVDKANCKLERVDGKRQILRLLSSGPIKKLRGVAGVVDADYWLIRESDELLRENLLYDSEYPDCELLMLESPALRKLLRNHLYSHAGERIVAFADIVLRDAVRLAGEFGYFRLLNDIYGYGMNFRSFHLAGVVSTEDLVFDQWAAARRLTSHMPGISSEEILEQVHGLSAEYSVGDVKLCNGHDVVEIMALILPGRFEREFKKQMPTSVKDTFRVRAVSANLRAAYDFTYFAQSSLFAAIRAWETVNSPYRIIRDFPTERTPA